MAKGKDSRRREKKKPKKGQVYITQETRFYISPTVCGQNYIYPLGVGMGVGGVGYLIETISQKVCVCRI